ncbi:sensor histidine kinase [Nocardia alni]|uniref:sensor histidine kinase n=1 Tax=Nocardia alni TaxID=2815723 RepID=UPI0027E16E83|nr:nitrate- and nitrite sensing domain-containing protein [Nocardia alni]
MLPAIFSRVRIRILAIALIPSLVLLVIGVVLTVGLVHQSREARSFANTLRINVEPARELILAAEQERLLSLWQLAGQNADPGALAAARGRFDKALAGIEPVEVGFARSNGGSVTSTLAVFDQLKTQLPLLRGAIDSGRVPVTDAYNFYSGLLEGIDKGTFTIEKDAPDITSALQLTRASDLLSCVEAMARSISLTALAVGDTNLSPALFIDYRNQVGWYHTQINKVEAGDLEVDPATQSQIKTMVSSPQWQRVTAMEDAILRPVVTKSGSAPILPMNLADWRQFAENAEGQMIALWAAQNDKAQQQATDSGDQHARNSLLAGVGTSAIAIIAFLLSLLLANQIIRRLERLRTETLALAEVGLPETMRKLGAGEPIDPETESARLDFGSDEIGSVANAFNRAHAAAVGAAITEARTREGVRAVFLNIAHRSQVVVHRILEVLDEAERKQEDPALLETFFRLDHLATRERRNAENLTILGGGRPGRKWRRPVPLIELVRGTVSETLDYARVQTGQLPQVYIVGTAVADLVHLLAELVDNAIRFSPAQSRVDVSAGLVGKGVAIEISDQGIGMAPEELERANAMLSDPPDFGIAALQADSRLGLFVVARLGSQHAISVRLSESNYGGIRAIVLVPTALITTESAAVERLPSYLIGHRADPPAPAEIAAAHSNNNHDMPAPQLESPPIATMSPPVPARRPEWAPETNWDEPPEPPAPRMPPPHQPAPARPALPRRRRQASLAPELTQPPAATSPESSSDDHRPRRARSAEQARDLISSIENGTRQGRRATRDQYPPTQPSAYRSDDEESNSDRYPRK